MPQTHVVPGSVGRVYVRRTYAVQFLQGGGSRQYPVVERYLIGEVTGLKSVDEGGGPRIKCGTVRMRPGDTVASATARYKEFRAKRGHVLNALWLPTKGNSTRVELEPRG